MTCSTTRWSERGGRLTTLDRRFTICGDMGTLPEHIDDSEVGLPVDSGTKLASATLLGVHGYSVKGTGIRIIVSTPASHPTLWQAHLDGLHEAFSRQNVGDAARVNELRTALVFTAVDDSGQAVAGIRSQGPLLDPEDSQTLQIWRGDPGVRSLLEGWIPDGAVETKGFWMAPSFTGRRELIGSLKRTPVVASAVLGARWAMGTAAHTMRLWTSAGATIVDSVDPVPYPNERYRTSLAFWDRWHWAAGVSSSEIRAVDHEVAELLELQLPAPRVER